jgi:hypothetical protein
LRASLAAVGSLLRALPLLGAPAPGTPLRVLCIAALDTLHRLRHGRPMSPARRQLLATFVDVQACVNAQCDGKPLSADTFDRLRRRVADAGLEPWLTGYVARVRALEAGRPAIGGDRRHFDRARAYREDVARLAVAAIAGLALPAGDLDDGIRATHEDADLAALFRLAMQCQVIDDALDYDVDLASGLPSLLTACASLPDGLALAADAARAYGACRGTVAEGALAPIRLSLAVLTSAAALAVAACGTGTRRLNGIAAKRSGLASP